MNAWYWPILGGCLGLVAGSFLATLVVRWPAGQRLSGRSRCDSCGVSLSARELVPLVSWALAGGRCRHCGAAIPAAHPAMEGAAALVGALALLANPSPLGLAGALFGWILLALLALDLAHLWLPDRLTLPLIGLGLLFGAGTPMDRLIGAALGGGLFLLLGLLYRKVRGRDGLGLGDAKLMAALGAWLSPPMIAPLILVSALVGLALAVVRARRAGAQTMAEPVPFGACLALAAFPLWLAVQAGAGA
jgi:leader peptidase (prepilin peptidase)/N-methyltransferase